MIKEKSTEDFQENANHLVVSKANTPDSNELAVERTVMAAERTLMSWTRTSISLISFGFTIYKFLQYMQEEGKIVISEKNGPRNFGLALILIGVLALLVASFQYRQLQKEVRPLKKYPLSLSVAVAWSIIALGAFALMNILFHIGPF
jgi:putative membrane protein